MDSKFIRVTKEFHGFIDKKRRKDETMEDTIRRLLKFKARKEKK